MGPAAGPPDVVSRVSRQGHSDPDRRRAANVATIEAMFAAFSAGDAGGLLAHVADDIVYEAPYYADFAARRGSAEMADMLRAVQQRFSRVRYEILEVFPTTDPDLLIVEVQGDNDVAGTARTYRNHYIQFIRFRDGRVSHWREFSNPDVYRTSVDA
jgi:ketosteroid isomerase-like protein